MSSRKRWRQRRWTIMLNRNQCREQLLSVRVETTAVPSRAVLVADAIAPHRLRQSGARWPAWCHIAADVISET